MRAYFSFAHTKEKNSKITESWTLEFFSGAKNFEAWIFETRFYSSCIKRICCQTNRWSAIRVCRKLLFARSVDKFHA